MTFKPFGSHLAFIYDSSIALLILDRLFHPCVPQLTHVQKSILEITTSFCKANLAASGHALLNLQIPADTKK